MPRPCLALSFLVAIFLAVSASAEETYFQIPLDKLPLTEGQLPGAPAAQRWDLRQPMRPYIALDGPGEGYAVMPAPPSPFGMQDVSAPPTGMAIHTPQSGEVTGRLFLAKSDGSGMIMVRIKVPADAAKTEAKEAFFQAKQAHYEQLLREGLPGAAWFRHEAREAAKSSGREMSPVNPPSGQPGQTDSFDQTFSLFSGGRAVSENLQLDRVLPATRPSAKETEGVDLKSIEGITVQPMNWKALTRDLKPHLDPLAALVPADQHAVFFSSFHSMLSLMDEAERFGTPVLQSIEPQSQDTQTRERYERQLGVSLTDLGRLVGPQLIGQVALTGSDPYLRTGSDVAILFQPRNAALLRTALMAQITQARQRNRESEAKEGETEGIAYKGVVSPDRTLSTYVAEIGNTLLLTNSLAQLERIAATQKGQAPSLATQPEYIYFRDRYRLGQGDETALVVLSDATIRRWCGPRWRIADSRRTRAAAALAEIQASHLAALAAPDAKLGPIPSPASELDFGQISLMRQGVASSIYGSLAMMTPIVELPMDRVSPEEADAYKRWRDSYQQNWRWSFDPIAIQLSIHKTKVSADVTVMPLIWATDYRDLVDITRGVKIAPDASDPHDALVHLVVAINQRARMVQSGTAFASNLAPGLKADPLGWLGQTVSLYIDDDPFWDELAKSGNSEEFMEKNVARLPVAIRADVSNGLKLTAFLVAVRGFIEQTAPEMTVWENLKHEGQSYVKITPSAKARGQQAGLENAAIYYAATGDSLLITLNEALLFRALDRQTARAAAAHDGKGAAPATQPWLGESIALRGRARALDLLMGGTSEAYQAYMQSLAWGNLPILNDWKRRNPDQDPQALHERLWQERLLDPAGGHYVWNEKWQTMESTVYGHPGEPKRGPVRPSALNGLSSASLGVTFEEQGLRGRVQIERAETPSAE